MQSPATQPSVMPSRAPGKPLWSILIILILITLTFAVLRGLTDWPHVAAGTEPDEAHDLAYVLNPALAYAHILPGVVYLAGAPFQLSRRFRERHFTVHRWMGRILLPAGITSGVFAIIFGTLFSFGGWLEASATIVFGHYFIVALATAYLAIKRGDVTTHRRWMIRAFAIGLAVGTIRIWIGLFQAFGLELDVSFGAAFLLSFPLHALAAEVYLRKRPSAEGAAAPAPAAPAPTA